MKTVETNQDSLSCPVANITLEEITVTLRKVKQLYPLIEGYGSTDYPGKTYEEGISRTIGWLFFGEEHPLDDLT